MMPAAHSLDDLCRARIAHRLQGFQGIRVIIVPRKDQVDLTARQLRHVFEQNRIVAMHGREHRSQLLGEGLQVRVSGKAGEAFQAIGCIGNGVLLLISNHLHAVLDLAQIEVGGLQVLSHSVRDPLPLHELFQCDQCWAHAQVGLAATSDQLLGLREELNFANATPAQLDVVARDTDAAQSAESVDLPLHGVDIGYSRKVKVLAPDEGRQLRQQVLASLNIAGDRPSLD